MTEPDADRFPADPGAAGAPPHDVLAAERFAMPAPREAIHVAAPPALPGDPSGLAEPHDVLAAEEFAMPAPRRRAAPTPQAPAPPRSPRAARALALVAGVLALAAVALRRRTGARAGRGGVRACR